MDIELVKDKENLTPKEIVKELDHYIIGQQNAKKSVAIALRNRYRRQQLPKEIADDIIPKNILMIGPTGVGKTEIARRLAKLVGSPFIKIEASKFTEVGYVGRDVESLIRDLVRISVDLVKVENMEKNKEKAKRHQRFFKTGPGEYGEGDIFVGVTVPELRKLGKQYKAIRPTEIKQLLQSPIHEERLLSLFLLINRYSKGDEPEKKRIYELYLKNTKFINNWDLVDCSAGHIVGAFLFNKSKKPLYNLADSENLWERRISIISTLYFIRHKQFADTLKIAKILLLDKPLFPL